MVVGGTMGKIPRFASLVSPILDNAAEVQAYARSAIAWYRANGRKRERFGHSLDRYGAEKALADIRQSAEGEINNV